MQVAWQTHFMHHSTSLVYRSSVDLHFLPSW